MAFNLLKAVITLNASAILPWTIVLSATESKISEQALFNQIKGAAKIIGQQKVWNYDNHQFTSENALNNYIAANNKIETIETTSNPNKIMTDYQNHILDPQKIYNTNFDSFTPVYRDAFGNATLNSKDALNTYSNNGLVKVEYGYNNKDWYSSTDEAKENYTDNGGIHKSLYYYINGRYYNAFNQNDQTILKNTLKEAYIVDANEFDNNKEVYGSPETLKNIIHNGFEKTWTEPSSTNKLNYRNFMKFETHHKLFITPDSSDIVGYWKDGTYERKSTLVIDDPSNQIALNEFSATSTGWKYSKEFYGAPYKDKWTKRFLTHANGENHDYLFEFKPKTSYLGGSSFFWDKLALSEEFTSVITLYDKDISDSNKTPLKNWETNSNITNMNEVSTQKVREAYDVWFQEFYDKEFFVMPDNQLDEFGGKYNKYGVHSGVLYGANGSQGHDFALSQSQKYYQEKIKPEKLKGPTKINEKGETTYEFLPDLYVTKTQLDNYLFLNGNVVTRVMYTYLDEQDISSLDGFALVNNEYDAKQRQLQLTDKVMFRRYSAYDVFGNYLSSATSKADALQQLHDTIKLQRRYINQREIDSWNSQLKSFDSIIEDGTYQVYRIFNETKNSQGLNPYIYFDSYQNALAAIKANINKETDITKTTVNRYYDLYIDQKHIVHNIIYTNDEQLHIIVKDLINNNK